MPGAAIPAYPYEGAFLWFLADDSARKFVSSYYQTLYGPHEDHMPVRAAALSCLFPEIVLAPADAQLPDSRSFTSDRIYKHPDLRLSMSWAETEWSEANQEIAKAAATDPRVRETLASLPHIGTDQGKQHHFLCRLVLQNRLASTTAATLIGNTVFQRIFALVAPWIVSITGDSVPASSGPTRLPISEEVLDVVGLNFAPGAIDAFAAIRMSSAITEYATSFREVLTSAASQPDLEQALLKLMKEAMDTSEIADQVASGFATSGSALGLLGFIPFVSTAASVLGVATDVGSRATEKISEKKSWYLIGAKMHEVAVQDLLKRRGGRTSD